MFAQQDTNKIEVGSNNVHTKWLFCSKFSGIRTQLHSMYYFFLLTGEKKTRYYY